MKTPGRHKQIQLRLVSIIGSECLKMEQRMPSIGRIADLVWEEKRLVFEVQCSPMSLAEAKKRTSDYALIGYDVIWLLDNRRFGRRRQTKSERWLRANGAKYFVLSNSIFYLYDSLDSFVGPLRVHSSYLGSIDIKNPYLRIHTHVDTVPRKLHKRWYQTRHLFPGDLLDTFAKGALPYLPKTKPAVRRHIFWLTRRLVRAGSFFLRVILISTQRKDSKYY